MTNQDTTLNSEWRKRINQIGKRAFEVEEMLRLGFLDASELNTEDFQKAAKDIQEVRKKIEKNDSEIHLISDIERAIETVRSNRIKGVKAIAEIRKKKKEEKNIERAAEIRERRINSPTFLGREVSHRLTFSGGDEETLKRNGLPILNSFLELASSLELEPQNLQWLVYNREDASTDHYTRFHIPKRTGGKRLISSPKPILRKAQSWVMEEILQPLTVHPAAMAFRPGLSVVDNASLHVGKEVVVRIDIKDFFPSITFPRVRGFFESLGYNPGISSVLAMLCTDSPRVLLSHQNKSCFVAVGNRSLPQGACTSPALANLITHNLDKRIHAYSEKAKWTYSRYADDLILSTNDQKAAPDRVVHGISNVIADEGFQVNKKKTRIMRKSNRQMVTGLVVNDDVRLSNRDLRRLRAFFHNCSIKGLETVSNEIGKDAMSVARGHLAYVNMISPAAANKLRQRHPWVLNNSSITRVCSC